jgi:hypothetical protein
VRTILEIGYNSFLLPPKSNVNSILGALSEAIPVASHYAGSRYVYTPSDSNIEVKVTMVSDSQIVEPPKPPAPFQIPEKASPDAHNTDIAAAPIIAKKAVDTEDF